MGAAGAHCIGHSGASVSGLSGICTFSPIQYDFGLTAGRLTAAIRRHHRDPKSDGQYGSSDVGGRTCGFGEVTSLPSTVASNSAHAAADSALSLTIERAVSEGRRAGTPTRDRGGAGRTLSSESAE
eukprot:COSAG02_NODE_5176_length_4570_cov_1.927086_5_plen_126_part_00